MEDGTKVALIVGVILLIIIMIMAYQNRNKDKDKEEGEGGEKSRLGAYGAPYNNTGYNARAYEQRVNRNDYYNPVTPPVTPNNPEQPLIPNFRFKTSTMKRFYQPISYDVETQGKRKFQWNTNFSGLVEICKLFNASVGWFNTDAGLSQTVIFSTWVKAFLKEMRYWATYKSDGSGIVQDWNSGWGKNWTTFWPVFVYHAGTTLAYYILMRGGNPELKTEVAKFLLKIIPNPATAMDMELSPLESVLGLFPYIVASRKLKLMGYDENEAFKNAIVQFDLRTNGDSQNPYYRTDFSRLMTENIFSFHYLTEMKEMYSDLRQVAQIRNDFENNYDELAVRLYHPTISLNGCANLFNFNGMLTVPKYNGSKHFPGMFIIPSMVYFRIHKPNYLVSIFTGGFEKAYFNSNITNKRLSSFIFCKDNFSKTGQEQPEFPFPGLIASKSLGSLEDIGLDENPYNTEPPPRFVSYLTQQTSEVGSRYGFVDYDQNIAYLAWNCMNFKPLLPVDLKGQSIYFDNSTEKLYYSVAFGEAPKNYFLHWFKNEKYDLSDIENSTFICGFDFKNEVVLPTKMTRTYPYGAPVEYFNKNYIATFTDKSVPVPIDVKNPTYQPTDNITKSGNLKRSKYNFTIIHKNKKPFIYIPHEGDKFHTTVYSTFLDPYEEKVRQTQRTWKYNRAWNQWIDTEYKQHKNI